MKKFGAFALLLSLGMFSFGCQPNVQEEKQDVQEAQQEGAENVQEEKQDVIQAEKQAAENVQEEKQDVQQAQQEKAQENQQEAVENTEEAPANP
jgi:hypothetical protein